MIWELYVPPGWGNCPEAAGELASLLERAPALTAELGEDDLEDGVWYAAIDTVTPVRIALSWRTDPAQDYISTFDPKLDIDVYAPTDRHEELRELARRGPQGARGVP